nr:phage terminase small subunit [uncultured Sphingomonas sp.]
MSLARQHQARVLGKQTAAAVPSSGGHVPARSTVPLPVDRAATTMARQIGLRLTHDLRRLKEIKSVADKIAAKREMLPEYAAWVEGLLAGSAEAGAGISGEVLPTVMIWRIDVGDYAGALTLAEHVLRHRVALPTRYERDAPTLIVEEIAEAAIKAQAADDPFELAVLERVEALVDGIDMYDQVRAKLMKAIGCELGRAARHPANADSHTLALRQRALAALEAAQKLNDRVGVKTTIRTIKKALAAAAPQPDPAGTPG